MIETLERKLVAAGNSLAERGVSATVGVRDIQDNPVMVRGVEILMSGGRLLMPLCLNNPYWSDQRVGMLVLAHLALGETTSVLVADGPAAHNYTALGYDDETIRSRVSEGARRLFSRVDKATGSLSMEERGRLIPWRWDSIITHEAWRLAREEICKLFDNNDDFRQDVLALSKSVLSKQYAGGTRNFSSDSSIRLAANYALDEIAAFGASADILGVSKTCLLYHKRWPVYEKWANGIYNGVKAEKVGFLLLHVEDASNNNLQTSASPDYVERRAMRLNVLEEIQKSSPQISDADVPERRNVRQFFGRVFLANLACRTTACAA